MSQGDLRVRAPASITIEQLLALNEEIRALVRAGVPLERGLLMAARELRGRLSRITGVLAARLDRGESLVEALDNERQALPPLYRAVVKAGARSGQLPIALEGLARYVRGYSEARATIGLALWYPLLVLILGYGLLVGLVTLAVPQFLAAFESLLLTVPAPLRWLGRLGETAQYWWPVGPIAIVILAIAWMRSGRASLFQSSAWGWLRIFPWMSSILANYETANFADLLALLLEHQVTYPEALVLAAESTGNSRLIGGATALAQAIDRGEPTAQALATIDRRAFLPMLRWVLATGPEQGSLSGALQNLGQHYRKRAKYQAEKLAVFLPTVLMIAIGASATMFYALSLFLPVVDMLESAFVSLKGAAPESMGQEGGIAGMSDSSGANGMSGRLTGREAADLSSQIAGLARAGLPLAQGLAALGEEMPRGRLRRSIVDLARTLESGTPLEEAMKTHESSIPSHLRGLVVAGMRSGEMGDLLGRFSDYVNIGAELNRKLWLSLAYPALTAAIALALVVAVCVVVVKQFETLFKDFGIPLPRLTRALLTLSRGIDSAWSSLAIIAGAILCIWLAARVLLPRALRRSLAGRLPLLGRVWRSISLAEFCHLLALLVEGRLPMPEALRLTGEGVENTDIDSACRLMAGQVESGRSLAQAMALRSVFPFGLPRLLRWAENQKSFPEVLHMAGLMFEARARSQSAFVGVVLNFACVILVFGMVLVVPALFVPLITLIARLAG